MTQDDNYHSYEDEQPQEQQHQYQPPTDPAEALVEAIQFGDPKDAANRLKSLLFTASEEAEFIRKRQAEVQTSMKTLEDFKRANPKLVDDVVIEAAIHRKVVAEQLSDLAKISDVAAWEKTLGRPATSQEIAAAHLHFRTNGSDVRSAAKLLQDATTAVCTKFNLPMGEAKDATRLTQDRINQERRRRGLAERMFDDNQATTPNLALGPQAYTELMMGAGPGEVPGQEQPKSETQPTEPQSWARSRAIEEIMQSRQHGRGRNAALLRKE